MMVTYAFTIRGVGHPEAPTRSTTTLAGGGTAGEVLVGLKDVAMGARDLAGTPGRPSEAEGHVRVDSSPGTGEGVGIHDSTTGHDRMGALGDGESVSASPEHKPITDGPYIKDGKQNGRPRLTGKAKLEFEQAVYERQVDADGILRDPNTGDAIDWKPGQPRRGVCDFGHVSGKEYSGVFAQYRNGEISLEQLKAHEYNSGNFQIETVHNNRSHAFEAGGGR